MSPDWQCPVKMVYFALGTKCSRLSHLGASVIFTQQQLMYVSITLINKVKLANGP